MEKLERVVNSRNRFFVVLLTMCLFFWVMPFKVFATPYANDTVYEIGTVEELVAFKEEVKEGNTSIDAVLTATIDMSSITDWDGIASVEKPYKGTFDGKGHTIYNLTGTHGLFVKSVGTVKNVNMSDVSISGGGNLGALVGENTGMIQGCVSSGSIQGIQYSIGGIVGHNNGGTINGCLSSCNTFGPTYGGLVGSNFTNGKMSNCYYGGSNTSIEGDNVYGQASANNVYYKRGDDYVNYKSSNNVSVETLKDTINSQMDTMDGYFKLSIEDGSIDIQTDKGYQGFYDGKEHGIMVEAPIGSTVKYGTVEGVYNLSESPTICNVGSLTVYYEITKNNTVMKTNSMTVKILPVSLLVTANDCSIVYGDTLADAGVSYSGFVNGENESVLSGMLQYDYNYTQYDDVGDYKITPKGLTSENYDIQFVSGNLKVNKKEIGIQWSNTNLVYKENINQKPFAIPVGVINNDDISLTVSGEQSNANTVDNPFYQATISDIKGNKAKNYILPVTGLSTTFVIAPAKQIAPIVQGIDETIFNKADGKLIDVSPDMEYRKKGENSYIKINHTQISNLPSGKYFVRYAKKDNYEASPDFEIQIAKGKKLSVNVPNQQLGYTLFADSTQLDWHGKTELSFSLMSGYKMSEKFAIKVNGVELKPKNGKYVIEQVENDVNISVEGVVKETENFLPSEDSTMNTPATGNNNDVGGWCIVAIVSASLSILAYKRRKILTYDNSKM